MKELARADASSKMSGVISLVSAAIGQFRTLSLTASSPWATLQEDPRRPLAVVASTRVDAMGTKLGLDTTCAIAARLRPSSSIGFSELLPLDERLRRALRCRMSL
jgi:hypothetical protein